MRAKEQPIIIVRRKKAGHGHHGGAWKVAYADFVTAMMAFFLVMWLAAQDSRIRDAVAGYFQEPGLLPNQTSNNVIAQGNGGIDSAGMPVLNRKLNGHLQAEQKALVKAAEHIRDGLAHGKAFAGLKDQVEFSVTTEGLRIELVDRSGSSFFDSGSSELRGESVAILAIIAAEVGQLPNDVVVEGHTDGHPYVHGERFTNWELSSERANAARRVMTQNGLGARQLRAVRGFADMELRLPDDPMDSRNRRVSIVVRSMAAVAAENALRAPKAVPALTGSSPETMSPDSSALPESPSQSEGANSAAADAAKP